VFVPATPVAVPPLAVPPLPVGLPPPAVSLEQAAKASRAAIGVRIQREVRRFFMSNTFKLGTARVKRLLRTRVARLGRGAAYERISLKGHRVSRISQENLPRHAATQW
jgi:uncharacterized protein with von Willebrand factor type A (vWA) domain